MSAPSFCLPHVPYFVSAEQITYVFNELFQADCVLDVHIKRKQFVKDGATIDYNLCFIHFKEDVDVNVKALEKVLDDIKTKGFCKVKPDSHKPHFWKVFTNTKGKPTIEE